MTRVIDPDQLMIQLDALANQDQMGALTFLDNQVRYGQRTLGRTDILLEAAADLADKEIKELRDAGYTVSTVNPLRLLKASPSMRFTKLARAFDTAAEEDRFNND